MRRLFISITLLVNSTIFAVVTNSIDPSRTTGVAPLAVFFDASGTTSTTTSIPFHEVNYLWDFGDPTAGNWQYGNSYNRDKNEAYGPVSAHVFETPGIYTVTLTSKDTTGDVDADTVTITVTDPNTVFPATNTICFSTSGTFTGCPSGASHINTSSWDFAMESLAASKRLLFRRTETFIATDETRLSNSGPGIIGAYGNGVRPIINATALDGSDNLLQLSRGSSGFTDDWRLMDLDLQGPSNESEMLRSDNTVNNFLSFNLRARNFFRHNSIANSGVEWHESIINANIFIVGNDFSDAGFHGVFTSAEGLAILGNNLADSPNSHILRITYANPVVISNNYIHGETNTPAQVIKFHSFNPAKAAQYNQLGSGRFVISDNRIEHGSQGSWMMGLGPESANHHYAHHIGNGIFERNHFVATATTQALIKIWGDEMTFRNNLFDQLGSSVAVTVDRRHAFHNAPNNNRFYNNTFYTESNGLTALTVDDAINTVVQNNLYYTGNGTGNIRTGSSIVTESNNFILTGLSASDPNYFLPIGIAIDGGATVPVFDDYVLTPRIGLYEVGALDQTSTLSDIIFLNGFE